MIGRIDPQVILDTRKQIPLYQQRRFDIYHDVSESANESEDGRVVLKK